MSAPWIIAYVALWVVVLFTGSFVLGLTRRILAVVEQAEKRLGAFVVQGLDVGGATPGTLLPAFQIRDDAGTTLSSSELNDRARVFVFLGADCAPCRDLAEDVRSKGGASDLSRPVHVVVDDFRDAEQLGLKGWFVSILEQVEGTATRAFENSAKPQAFLVGEGGVVVASLVPKGLAQLRQLAEREIGGDIAPEPGVEVVPY